MTYRTPDRLRVVSFFTFQTSIERLQSLTRMLSGCLWFRGRKYGNSCHYYEWQYSRDYSANFCSCSAYVCT